MSKNDPKDFSEPPFDVYIHAADETLKFKSYDKLRDWALHQVELWEPAGVAAGNQGKLTQHAWQQIDAYFGTLHSHATKMTTDPDPNTRTKIATNLEWLENGTRITADSPAGQRIIELAGWDPEAAAARMVWAVRDQLANHGFAPKFLVRMIEVGIEDRAGQTEPRVHEARLTKMQHQWDQTFTATETRARDRVAHGIHLGRLALRHFRRMKENHAKAADDHAEEMARIERTFMERMRLEAPASYWSERVTASNRTAGLALAAFIGVGAAAAFSLFWNWDGVKELIAVSNKSAGINLLPAVAITLPAVLLLWLLRLISRIFVSGLSTARDSSHRSTLIQTYLALMAEEGSGVTEHDRLLILQALFRPESATADDDAPPPHLLEIMARTAGLTKK